MATKKQTKKAVKAAKKAAPATDSRELRPSGRDVTITISGPAEHVRRALDHMRFARPAVAALEGSDGLSVGEGRAIAREQTRTPSAKMTDTLGATPINFGSPGLLDAYKDRCLRAAEDAGHPIIDESSIPNKPETKVFEVGDALSKFSS